MTTVIEKPAKSASPTKSGDATTLLRADHKLVSGLFEAYEKASTKAMKLDMMDLGDQITARKQELIAERN